MNKHGSVLPYINICSPFGRPLKFLIDTGASSSFINPEYLQPEDFEEIKPIVITTILNHHKINKRITLPNFLEFNQPGETSFLIFKFHGYFDGLLGLDTLSALGATVDLANKLLITQNSSLPLNFKPNYMSENYIVPPNSKIIAKLPVDIENGDIYIRNTTIKPGVYIPEGIYCSKGWYSHTEVVNSTNTDQKLFLEQPIKVEPFATKYVDINLNMSCPETEIASKDISQLIRTDHLNKEEKDLICHICREFDDIFYREEQRLSFTNQVKHRIQTTDDIPIYTKSYRYPFVHKEEVRRQISNMLEQGIIRPSYSPWSSPVWIVPKKKDASGKQKWRLVIDYRKLNEKTVSDRYPLPNITEILDKLGKSMYFTTLDLASGFHQIEMDPRDVKKTAFTVEGGHFEYVRMPFGLKNAPSTFQRVMDNVLQDLQGKICLVYLDDIIVFSTSLQEHGENIRKVFHKLREANLKVQLDKSEFLHKEIAFLGHIVTTDGVKPNPEKVRAIKEFPVPRTQKEIKGFLGLLGYYRKFIKDFAKLTKPLTECLKKGRKIDLNDRYIKAFQMCKNLLMNDPILQYPDFTKPFILTTDASNFAIGAVLSQGTIGSDLPVCYASRTLTDSETNYSTIEKELLAIVWATKYFRPYLFGRPFKIVTDHKPLTWLMSLKDPNSKLVRWRLKLEEFDYQIVYKKGTQNSNADALSRTVIPKNANFHQAECNTADQNEPKESDNNSTIHSATEDMNDGIPISERPINEFNLQIVFEKTHRKPPTSLEVIFRNKHRRTFRLPTFTEENITKILKEYLAPNKISAVYADDDTFKLIQKVYSKYFSNTKILRLIRCTEILIDVTDNDEQNKLIYDYHMKNNHRGINETLRHLKRQYFFPFLKNKIIATINNCDTCNRLKYDRHPPKPKFETPEQPLKPLDILHIDIYTINHKQILTLIDKFSKFAAAYTLAARNSLNIVKSIKHFMSLHGTPQKIISDQGSEFTANIFKDFCNQYNIELHLTSFQQSSSNSPVERLHSTLTEIYRIILHKYKEKNYELDHDEILSETLITYNNAIHSTTKHSPFELFTGKTFKFNKNLQFSTEHEYLNKLGSFQKELYPAIKAHVEELVNKNIENLNINREDPSEFKANETVYRKECRRNKITPRFKKCKVKENNKITIITHNNQKLHKAKLKRKRQLQTTDNTGTKTTTARLTEQPGTPST